MDNLDQGFFSSGLDSFDMGVIQNRHDALSVREVSVPQQELRTFDLRLLDWPLIPGKDMSSAHGPTPYCIAPSCVPVCPKLFHHGGMPCKASSFDCVGSGCRLGRALGRTLPATLMLDLPTVKAGAPVW